MSDEPAAVGVVNLPGNDESFLDLATVAKVFGQHPRTINRAVAAKKFPAPTRLGRKQYWPRPVLLAHMLKPSN